ncbi:transposase [Saccharothrix yanglingensis]|uniref:transposase n=1 Tax=Saccharothrix yanglingensis TaxID=659496 RepID=UPI003528642D
MGTAEKVAGRKRHIVVDTTGLLLALRVTPTSTQDRVAAREALVATPTGPGVDGVLRTLSARCTPSLSRTSRQRTTPVSSTFVPVVPANRDACADLGSVRRLWRANPDRRFRR